MPEIFEVTVRSGEDICKTISDFVTAHGWQNVMIPAAIGSVIGMEFTAPIRDELPQYDAIMTFCDIMGFEAYNALAKIGYRIPEDIMLASLDGLQQDIVLPIELTCAGTNRRLMAQKSMDLLLSKIRGSAPAEPQHICIEQYLLQGSTT